MKIKIKVTYNTSYYLKEMVTKAGCILFLLSFFGLFLFISMISIRASDKAVFI